MRAPDERELREMLAVMRSALASLEEGEAITAYDLVRMAAKRWRDGYRPSSGFDVRGTTTIYDDDGHPVPTVSDPTGEAVVANNPFAADRDAMVHALRRAKDALTDAVDAMLKAVPPKPGTGDPGCRVHARVKDSQGRPCHVEVEAGKEASERCSWCNDFKYSYGEDPIDGLVTAKERGERITSKVIEREYTAAGRSVPKLRDAYVALAAGRQ